ncbi:MAG: SDR family oxidoreductase [Chloroflexota bacterium]
MTTIVLVTGANRGIGKEVARQLAEQGATVLMGARSVDKAQSTADDLGLDGLVPVQLDVTNESSIQQLYAQVERDYGRLDVLINNAAINYDSGERAANVDLDQVRETLETNLFAAWRMMQVFLPLIRKSEHPRIVNVSSGSGSITEMGGGTPAYGVSKAALNAITRMIASETRGDRILVNAICPGWVATDMGGSGGRPVADGARGIVWAATLPDDGPTNGFFRDGKPIAW